MRVGRLHSFCPAAVGARVASAHSQADGPANLCLRPTFEFSLPEALAKCRDPLPIMIKDNDHRSTEGGSCCRHRVNSGRPRCFSRSPSGESEQKGASLVIAVLR